MTTNPTTTERVVTIDDIIDNVRRQAMRGGAVLLVASDANMLLEHVASLRRQCAAWQAVAATRRERILELERG